MAFDRIAKKRTRSQTPRQTLGGHRASVPQVASLAALFQHLATRPAEALPLLLQACEDGHIALLHHLTAMAGDVAAAGLVLLLPVAATLGPDSTGPGEHEG